MVTPKTSDLRHPDQPLGLGRDGCLRFKENPLVRHFVDEAERVGFDLNELMRRRQAGRVEASDADWAHLMQLIGYSLSGWAELSAVSEADVARVRRSLEPLAVDDDLVADLENAEERIGRVIFALEEAVREPLLTNLRMASDALGKAAAAFRRLREAQDTDPDAEPLPSALPIR